MDKTFQCDIHNVVNNSINTFKLHFIYTQQVWIKISDINRIIKKVIWRIFDISLFEIYHLHV